MESFYQRTLHMGPIAVDCDGGHLVRSRQRVRSSIMRGRFHAAYWCCVVSEAFGGFSVAVQPTA